MDLISRVISRETRALARALTLAENGDVALLDALDARLPGVAQPARIGITGPPGSGKSTLTSAMVKVLRAQGRRVGVVAVDPSSPFSGGALLGDRLRMAEHTLDADVFVRSMASRGRFGGLAISAEDACDLMALAAYDPVMVETVGVGQSEVDIAKLADTTVVVLTPAAGDSVQALKAGIMEIADVVAINKADQEGAERLEEDVREGMELRPHGSWQPPIVRTTATEGKGAAELLEAIAVHRKHLESTGGLQQIRRARLDARLLDLAAAGVVQALQDSAAFRHARAAVAEGRQSPRQAIRALTATLKL